MMNENMKNRDAGKELVSPLENYTSGGSPTRAEASK
jgi:hypothetical protein